MGIFRPFDNCFAQGNYFHHCYTLLYFEEKKKQLTTAIVEI